jgi:hydrogenase maturation protease
MNNTSFSETIAVIGIGNPLLGDDGVGVEVIKELEGLELPEHVKIYDGGVGGLSLLGLIEGHREVIFVDALEMGLEPGSVRQLDVECYGPPKADSGLSFSFRTGLKPCPYKMVEPRLRYSLHEASLQECLPFLKLGYNNNVKITVIGIQPRRVSPGIGLSPEVRGAVPEVIGIILKGLGVRDG